MYSSFDQSPGLPSTVDAVSHCISTCNVTSLNAGLAFLFHDNQVHPVTIWGFIE